MFIDELLFVPFPLFVIDFCVNPVDISGRREIIHSAEAKETFVEQSSIVCFAKLPVYAECLPTEEVILMNGQEAKRSWDERRAARRRRYKRDKSLSITRDLDPEYRSPSDHTSQCDIALWKKFPRHFRESPELPTEVPASSFIDHRDCSRRASIQMTDLDDRHNLPSMQAEEVSIFFCLSGKMYCLPIISNKFNEKVNYKWSSIQKR